MEEGHHWWPILVDTVTLPIGIRPDCTGKLTVRCGGLVHLEMTELSFWDANSCLQRANFGRAKRQGSASSLCGSPSMGDVGPLTACSVTTFKTMAPVPSTPRRRKQLNTSSLTVLTSGRCGFVSFAAQASRIGCQLLTCFWSTGGCRNGNLCQKHHARASTHWSFWLFGHSGRRGTIEFSMELRCRRRLWYKLFLMRVARGPWPATPVSL